MPAHIHMALLPIMHDPDATFFRSQATPSQSNEHDMQVIKTTDQDRIAYSIILYASRETKMWLVFCLKECEVVYTWPHVTHYCSSFFFV
jgi:hypothetical protein